MHYTFVAVAKQDTIWGFKFDRTLPKKYTHFVRASLTDLPLGLLLGPLEDRHSLRARIPP